MSRKTPSENHRFRTLVDAHYPAIQYHFVQMMTDHLADCSRAFKGDLQQLVILALIGQVHLEHYRKNNGDITVARGISTSRLADLTGISRQTIRRRLERLAKNDWIEPTILGSWRIKVNKGAAQAGKDLGDLDRRNRDRIAKFIGSVAPLLKAQDIVEGDKHV